MSAPTVPSPTAPKENKQLVRSQRSTASLLEAASELIVEGGYVGMTLAAIGERAGYSRGLATSRFGSKEKLLQALVERITTTWNHRAVLPAIEGKSGFDATFIWIDAIRMQIEHSAKGIQTLYALCFEALGHVPELHHQIVELHEEMRSFTVDVLERGIADGSIRADIPVEEEAGAIIASLRGIAYLWLLEPDDFDAVGAMKYMMSTTKDRLRPPLSQRLEKVESRKSRKQPAQNGSGARK